MNTKKQEIVTTIRLPIDLHAEIKEAASVAGHPMNAEIIARLTAYPKGTTLNDLSKQGSKTQEMIQVIIDAISPRR